MTHEITRIQEGGGYLAGYQSVCTCGWKGQTYYVTNDYCYSLLAEQENKHRSDCCKGGPHWGHAYGCKNAPD